MFQFWESTLQPLLEARAPKRVVEIGAWEGANTKLLADWAKAHDAMLHVIDPKPRFDTDEYTRLWAGHIEIHRELSLQALEPIGPVDMMFIDGDHNWYTVFNELQLIDRINSRWPLIVIHDVGWPYGRRDMYYAPETVPSEYVQPHRQSGIVRGRSALADRGRHRTAFNAEREGGPRNGVLTAIEDFLAQTNRDLLLLARPGFAGLGVLVSAEDLERDPQLAGVAASVHNPSYTVRISPVYAARELGEDSPAQPRPRRGRLSRRLRDAQWQVRLRLGLAGRA